MKTLVVALASAAILMGGLAKSSIAPRTLVGRSAIATTDLSMSDAVPWSTAFA